MLGAPSAGSGGRREGRSPEPLACLVTRTGELPTDIPLFDEPEAQVIVFTCADIELEACAPMSR